MPEFPRDELSFKLLIAKSVKYPANCIKNGISGRSYVQFIVGTTGEIEQVKVIKKYTLILMPKPGK
jgi:outer membrane biosynthesis protein TonB